AGGDLVRGGDARGDLGGAGGLALADGDGDPVAGEVGLEPLGGVVGDDPAVIDDHHALGHRVRLVEAAGGEGDRGAVLRAQPPDVLPQVGAVVRVEPGGGLVE